MAFCEYCGTQLPEGANNCPNCGKPVKGEAQKDFSKNIAEKVEQFNNTADTTGEYETADIENNKVMSVLAYFGILVLIPIFAAKESKFARFHANQGLILTIFEIVLYFLGGIIPFIGFVFKMANLLCLILVVIGIINAVKGRAKELPLIGSFRILK